MLTSSCLPLHSMPVPWSDEGYEALDTHGDRVYRPWCVLPGYWAFATRKCAWKDLVPLQCEYRNNAAMCLHDKAIPEDTEESADTQAPLTLSAEREALYKQLEQHFKEATRICGRLGMTPPVLQPLPPLALLPPTPLSNPNNPEPPSTAYAPSPPSSPVLAPGTMKI